MRPEQIFSYVLIGESSKNGAGRRSQVPFNSTEDRLTVAGQQLEEQRTESPPIRGRTVPFGLDDLAANGGVSTRSLGETRATDGDR